jgi:hypothetical protein
MIELTKEDFNEVAGGASKYSRTATAALRFISVGARFGGPAGLAIGIGIEVYLQLR